MLILHSFLNLSRCDYLLIDTVLYTTLYIALSKSVRVLDFHGMHYTAMLIHACRYMSDTISNTVSNSKTQ